MERLQMHFICNVVLAFLNFSLLTFIGIRVWVCMPTNHWGFDIRFLYIVPALSLCYIFYLIIFGIFDKKYIITLFASLVFMLTIYIFDNWNLLVEYEVWIKRGMPNFGQRSQKHLPTSIAPNKQQGTQKNVIEQDTPDTHPPDE